MLNTMHKHQNIFLATHPRSCSTAFERVFMTRSDLQCVHEPFGDAFYYGPERLGSRYENDEESRIKSGFSESTFKSIFDRMAEEQKEGKRLFIKDMIYYLIPPDGGSASIAPSLVECKDKANGLNGTSSVPASEPTKESKETTNGTKTNPPFPYPTEAEPGNPTVVPKALLEQFHYTFLIRHPRSSIPSYYRCTVPPLDKVTGFYNFMPEEAGYVELRRMFDYLRESGQVGTTYAGRDPVPNDGTAQICVVDADDLLDNPSGIVEAYCKSVGLDFSPDMLKWDSEENQKTAKEAFEKWNGFHEDAIHSTELKPRVHKKTPKSDEQLYEEWVEKFGEEAALVIKETVKNNVADYEYLKQFAIKV